MKHNIEELHFLNVIYQNSSELSTVNSIVLYLSNFQHDFSSKALINQNSSPQGVCGLIDKQVLLIQDTQVSIIINKKSYKTAETPRSNLLKSEGKSSEITGISQKKQTKISHLLPCICQQLLHQNLFGANFITLNHFFTVSIVFVGLTLWSHIRVISC